jgi:hypothetical protein
VQTIVEEDHAFANGIHDIEPRQRKTQVHNTKRIPGVGGREG